MDGLSTPTAMEFAPDGRLFVAERAGRLRVIQNSLLLPTPFVTVNVATAGEQGLLGVAFDPAFSVNHYVYIYYTTSSSPVHNRISRLTANGNVAVTGSEVVLLDLPAVGTIAHQGGAIHFGLDGKLFIAVGDHQSPANSQSLANVFGKVLRINADGTIPADNPFYAQASGINRATYALGFRNPFTFAVDPGSGRIFVNDVGQSTWEEVNQLAAGANYGWPICEGPRGTGLGSCDDPGFTYPLHAYNHNGGDAAITGGAFYRGTRFPSQYDGSYFFADYTQNWIRYLDLTSQVPGTNNLSTDFSQAQSPVDLKVGPDGALYYLSIGTGAVYRVEYVSSGAGVTKGDLDGDGRRDVLWRQAQTGDVAAWLMNGVTVKQGPVVAAGVPLAWQIVGVGDLDGDGRADLVWRQTQTGDLAVWLMNGVTVKQGPVIAAGVPLAWQIVGVGDLDGDGRADLVWRHAQTGDVAAWLMNGVTVKQRPVIAAGVPLAWQVVDLGDLDGDGKADLLWRQTQTGDLAVWLMNGVSVKQGPLIALAVPLAWQIVGLGDVDGDGKADVLWRQSQTGDLAVWLMNGNAVKLSYVVAPAVPLVWQVQR